MAAEGGHAVKVLKQGGHPLFKTDPEVIKVVSDMLSDLGRRAFCIFFDMSGL